MKTNIYILQLKHGKYYVGKSCNLYKRFCQHISGNGAYWTKYYKPIKIEKVIKNVNSFDEDRYVKEYMNNHGIDNVRGGSYLRMDLNVFEKHLIKKEIWGATDKCIRCGRDGHYISNCFEYDLNNEQFNTEMVTSFEKWKYKVEIIVHKETGLHLDELPDENYHINYENGMNFTEMANYIILHSFVPFMESTELKRFNELFNQETLDYVNRYITSMEVFNQETMENIFELFNQQDIFSKEMKNKYSLR